MPLAPYLMYQAGYVPPSDAEAQKRCYETLSQVIVKLNRAISGGDDGARSTLQQLHSVRSLIKDVAGSYDWRKANTFWTNWDNNKRQVIALSLESNDEEQFLTEVEKLEDGRYYDA